MNLDYYAKYVKYKNKYINLRKQQQKMGGASLTLSSPAFVDGGFIPVKYSCDSGTESGSQPPLKWSNVPKGTVSFAITVEDPDAQGKIWEHWNVWNIPGDKTDVSGNFQVGKNTKNELEFRNPCPSSGSKPHRYIFTLYAVDKMLNLEPAITDKKTLLDALKNHILGKAKLIGKYKRK